MSDKQTRTRKNSKKKNKKHAESVQKDNDIGASGIDHIDEPVNLKKRNSKRRKLRSLLKNSIGKLVDDKKHESVSDVNKDISENMDDFTNDQLLNSGSISDVHINCNENIEKKYEDENQNIEISDIEIPAVTTQLQYGPNSDAGSFLEYDLDNSGIKSVCDRSEDNISKDMALQSDESYIECSDEISSPGHSRQININDTIPREVKNSLENLNDNRSEISTYNDKYSDSPKENFESINSDKDNCDCIINDNEFSTDSNKNALECNKENCSDNNENFHLVPESSSTDSATIGDEISRSDLDTSDMNIDSVLTMSNQTTYSECNNDSHLISECDPSINTIDKQTIDSNLQTNNNMDLNSVVSSTESQFTRCNDSSSSVSECDPSISVTKEETTVNNLEIKIEVDFNEIAVNDLNFSECNNNLIPDSDTSNDKINNFNPETSDNNSVSASITPPESGEQMSEFNNNFNSGFEFNLPIKENNDIMKTNLPKSDKDEVDGAIDLNETQLPNNSNNFNVMTKSDPLTNVHNEEISETDLKINDKSCVNVDLNLIVLNETKNIELNNNLHLISESDPSIGVTNKETTETNSRTVDPSTVNINLNPLESDELEFFECDNSSSLIPEINYLDNEKDKSVIPNNIDIDLDPVVPNDPQIDNLNLLTVSNLSINIIDEESVKSDVSIESSPNMSKEFIFPECAPKISKQFLSDPHTTTLDEIELISNPKQKDKKSSTANNIKKVLMSPFLKRKTKKDDHEKSNKSLERSNSRVSLCSLSEEDGTKKDTGSRKNPFHISSIIKKKSSKQHSIDSPDMNLKRSDSKGSVYSNMSDHKKSDELDRKIVSFGSEQSLSRKPSFIKKVTKFLGSTPNLHRVSSFRDVYNDKKYTDRLYDSRASGWSSSLQSLDENNVLIERPEYSTEVCDSMKGVQPDYDIPVNEYDEFGQRKLIRTQSLSMPNSSGVGRRCGVSHGAVFARHYQSNLDISAQTPSSLAVSLPALHCLPENVDLANSTSPNTPHHRYRRRVPSSICDDEDGSSAGSFQRAPTGSGCAKLKHHYRYDAQKRDAADTFSSGASSDTVRSRSLTHLDNLDPELLREPRPADTAGLKDSRSEPDCSMQHPLLAVPSTTSHPSAANRRHMMSRSQVSSSEYFSVEFDVCGDTHPSQGREEFLPATKGTVLADVLGSACERRGIDISNCDVFVEGRKSPLPHLSSETSWLGGKQLHVTARDPSNKKNNLSAHIRKSSGSYRSKTGKFFSISTEETSISPNTSALSLQDTRMILQDGENKKKEKQRWSGFFSNNKDTKMELLIDHLNNYSKQGVPKRTEQSDENNESIKSLYNLEDDWRQVINLTNTSEKEQQQQTALWELISTEAAYIKTLKVVTDLFLACLESLQASNILNEINKTKLFSNILGIHSANLFFWCKHIYPMLKHTRETGELLNPEYLLSGFVHFHEIFEPYTKYCSDQSKCQHYCKEMHSQNELFTAYLVWCETQKECNRLRLMDILVRPMQRLTKYGLLLKAVYKNSDLDSHKECLNAMIKSVDDFVNSVNSTLKYKQDSESLLRIMNRIESYDAVESKDDDLEKIVRNYSDIDLMRPMIGCNVDRRRHLLMEDDFKLKDNTTSKMEIRCVLFTDLLLVCKPSTKKGSNGIKVIRQPYLVDRLVSTDLNREPASMGFVYLNEFNMAIAAFTLQGDIKKLKNLLEYIAKAKALYRQAKLASTPVVRQQSVNEINETNDISIEYGTENDGHSLLGMPLFSRSPLANSSRGSRVSSLAHSHSGSVEMNDQSSIGSVNTQSRAVSVETDQRTASISSDEGVQSLPVETSLKSPVAPKSSLKHRLFNAHPRITTPNTLSVQPCTNLGQSLPNLTLGSPNMGTIQFISPSQNTLSVPNTTKNQQHLLSPNHRGISYPPPSPTRGNLRRGFAINQNKNPPLLKTRHVTSTVGTGASISGPMSIDIDVPVIPGVSLSDDTSESLLSGQQKQAINKRFNRSDNRRYHTAGVVDEIKKNDSQDTNLHKRLSWNCGSFNDQLESNKTEDHSSTT